MPKLPNLSANFPTEATSTKKNLSAIINNIKRFKSKEDLSTIGQEANLNQVILVFYLINYLGWLVKFNFELFFNQKAINL